MVKVTVRSRKIRLEMLVPLKQILTNQSEVESCCEALLIADYLCVLTVANCAVLIPVFPLMPVMLSICVLA